MYIYILVAADDWGIQEASRSAWSYVSVKIPSYHMTHMLVNSVQITVFNDLFNDKTCLIVNQMSYAISRGHWVNSVIPRDVLRHDRTCPTLVQIIDCCLNTWTNVDPSSIKSCGVHLQTTSTVNAQDINHYKVFKNCTFKITPTYPRVQCVNIPRSFPYSFTWCGVLNQLL